MMMSSVDHLGDAVLIAPHRAKHALSAAAAWHGNPLAPGRGREREGRRAASRRRQCVVRTRSDGAPAAAGDPALRRTSSSRHTAIR